LGCFGFAGFNLLHYHTLHYTSVINASLIQTVIPMMVLLLNRSLFKQTPMPNTNSRTATGFTWRSAAADLGAFGKT